MVEGQHTDEPRVRRRRDSIAASYVEWFKQGDDRHVYIRDRDMIVRNGWGRWQGFIRRASDSLSGVIAKLKGETMQAKEEAERRVEVRGCRTRVVWVTRVDSVMYGSSIRSVGWAVDKSRVENRLGCRGE